MFWAYDQSLRKSAYNEKTLHFISKTIRWIFRSWEVSWLKANDTSRYFCQSVQFSSSVVSDSLRPHGLQHARLPCPSPTPRACSNSIESVMPSNHLIVVPFSSHLQSFPAPGSFQMSQFFASSGQSIEVSAEASALQWIFRTDFLQNGLVWSSYSSRDSQESSPTPQFKSINSSALSFLYSPTLTSIHDHWKNHSLD